MKTQKSRVTISVVVIAKNEEKKIGDCLNSVKWADEIILIDNGSIDKTAIIAKKFGANVVSIKKGAYSDLRIEGLKKAKCKWILYVDADERVTPELEGEILEKIKTQGWQTEKLVAYAIPRENVILGKKLIHGGWWPDYVKRLFNKNKLKKWVGELHEEPVFDGELGLLQKPLIHLKHDNLSDMVEKTNIWSEVEAKLMLEARHPSMNIVRFFSAMFREFWLRLIKQKAFLDGVEGVIYALYQVYSKFISYAKLWEMQLQIKNSKLE